MRSGFPDEEFINPHLPDLHIKYFPKFLSEEEASFYFNQLITGVDWQQYYIKIFGKRLPQPRLTALYAEKEIPYTYSGLTLYPLLYPREIKSIQNKIELITPSRFTHCLANLYRNGQDSMGLHSDNEKELGTNPVIASISLGETRKFRLKHNYEKNLNLDLDLEPGSLLIMEGTTQHFWKHELPKTKKPKNPRINLTFRKIFT